MLLARGVEVCRHFFCMELAVAGHLHRSIGALLFLRSILGAPFNMNINWFSFY